MEYINGLFYKEIFEYKDDFIKRENWKEWAFFKDKKLFINNKDLIHLDENDTFACDWMIKKFWNKVISLNKLRLYCKIDRNDNIFDAVFLKNHMENKIYKRDLKISNPYRIIADMWIIKSSYNFVGINISISNNIEYEKYCTNQYNNYMNLYKQNSNIRLLKFKNFY